MINIFLLCFVLAVPSITETKDDDIIRTLGDVKDIMGDVEVLHFEHYEAREVGKLRFIETKFQVTQDNPNDPPFKFSIWMPSRDLHEDYILISRPGLITGEMVMLAYDILKSM